MYTTSQGPSFHTNAPPSSMSHIPNTNTVPASTGGCTSATATTAGSASDEVAPAGPTDPDIPRLTLTLTESMDVRDDDKDVCSPMHVDQYDYDGQQETEAAVHAVERKTGFEVLEYRRYPERAEDEEEEELCSELGNEQDDEDDHETDKAEEDDDEREGGGDDEEEDRASQFAVEIEASFISRTKPACSKTTLVSCLSARSVSPGPGPISPLLSEDDYMNAHGTSASASSSDFYTPPTSATPSLLSCNSASSSRRSSSGAHTPRVRFKRGCVITAVNLTWAAATYDRVSNSRAFLLAHTSLSDAFPHPLRLLSMLQSRSTSSGVRPLQTAPKVMSFLQKHSRSPVAHLFCTSRNATMA